MDRSLYQKYRPQSFKNVRDQKQIISVLENALKKENVTHAYLFTGPRGIGKTSVARIFANSLGSSEIDIFEIDAASHTSVDNIRDISNSVYTQPVESKYKVYILDEVHMLSKAAFNSFLKTLEEPPKHAIFVLVTTEEDKVPETIVSRCLSLRFKQPSLSVLQDTAISIAKKEGYILSKQSAFLVSLISEGSFRDTLTLLQKVLFVTETKEISHEVVENVLGVPKHKLVNEYITSFLNKDVEKGIKTLEEVSKENLDILLFSKLCIRKLRLIILYKEGFKDKIDEYMEDDQDFIKEMSKNKSLDIDILKKLTDASRDIKNSYIKTLPLEYLLLKR